MQPVQPQVQAQLQATAPESAHKNRFSNQNRMAGSQPVWHPKMPLQADFAPQLAPETALTPSGVPTGERMGFADVLDVVNPLQHIPVVSSFYRQATGDKIGPMAQFIGGAIFGGPIGAVGAMVGIAIQDKTGKDLTENMTALVTDRDNAFKAKTPDIDIQIADGSSLNALDAAAGHVYTFNKMPRTAGLMPVWGHKATEVAALETTPPTSLSSDTHFAAMLERLENENPNMS